MLASASPAVVGGFFVVVTAVLALWLVGVWRWARPSFAAVLLGTALWAGLFAALAESGILARFDARPPPLLGVVIATGLMGVWLGRSKRFDGVPIWAIVLANGFRLPLELVMHAAAQEGTMPTEMSFSGYNFDIVSGVVALVVGIALWRGAPRWLAKAWAVLGLILLLIIVGISGAATPLVHAFGPAPHLNLFIAYLPFVYLPTVCVVFALGSHIAVLRRSTTPTAPPVPRP